MGWCSATEIMDTAIGGALDVLRKIDLDRGTQATMPPREKALELLRPMVAVLAEQLRSQDWDCIEESDYFPHFPQEMLGLSGAAWDNWVSEQLEGWDGTLASWPSWAGPPPAIVQA